MNMGEITRMIKMMRMRMKKKKMNIDENKYEDNNYFEDNK